MPSRRASLLWSSEHNDTPHGPLSCSRLWAPKRSLLPTTSAANGSANGSANGGAHGIIGMRERATLLGGRLETAAEHGTFRLRAWLPHPPAP